ncbi:hypothetical protein R6Q59_021808 [Mikania micrantha]
MGSYHGSSSARGLSKTQLGGVIFGANKTTINECFQKKLFGLPGPHFGYVRKIEPGLPLFLFNYTDRTLLGIFEAASPGQMNIDPHAWTCEGSQKTPYPAQVQIRVKFQCKMLTENQFKPIIVSNYYTSNHFWFELDHVQRNQLFYLLASQAICCQHTTLAPRYTTKRTTLSPPVEYVCSHLKSANNFHINIKQDNTYNKVTKKDAICMKLKELSLKHKLMAGPPSHENYTLPKLMGQAPVSSGCKDESVERKEGCHPNLSKNYFMIAQLVEKIEELITSKAVQKDNINNLEEKIAFLQQKLTFQLRWTTELCISSDGLMVTMVVERVFEFMVIELKPRSLVPTIGPPLRSNVTDFVYFSSKFIFGASLILLIN